MSDFTERTTWRDTLSALLARVRNGDDVDPAELADTRAKADAEAEVEAGRASRRERKRAQAEQDAAREHVTATVAGLEPDARAAALKRVNAAWEAYLDVVEAEQESARDYKRTIAELVPIAHRAFPDGAPDNRAAPGVVVVDGRRYGVYSIAGRDLPHRDKGGVDYRRDRIDRAA